MYIKLQYSTTVTNTILKFVFGWIHSMIKDDSQTTLWIITSIKAHTISNCQSMYQCKNKLSMLRHGHTRGDVSDSRLALSVEYSP